MLKITKSGLKEIGYDMSSEAKIASIFGIGNGYFGIRGSLEEFGDVFIQGTYIRGVFDSIVEIPVTFSDNIYMRKWYFDHQKLKEFEYEDSCINIFDPLLIRIHVGSLVFMPWEGKILKWERYIDYKTGGLVRNVLWDDGNGNITSFKFFRVCSFASNHIILQEVEIEKVNHDLDVKIEMGIDTLVKTNGQHKSKITNITNEKDVIKANFNVGPKYNMNVACKIINIPFDNEFIDVNELEGCYYSTYKMQAKKTKIRKISVVAASIDPLDDYQKYVNDAKLDYDFLYQEHLHIYQEAFKSVDIKISGNNEYDHLLRYANYQTLIGFDRYDSVHSLSAKNLTAEKYNQFVWWDAEIFQLPFVIASFPSAAKHCLEYRYRHLKQAKENAKLENLDGAKYAFCSSVKGDENVWIYARHPFLQIHISADVAYGTYNYYKQTLDKEFMLDKGLEMMIECVKYFISRSTLIDGKYNLFNVTGTDEHHPYVNNDAYTNYEVRFIASKVIDLIQKLDYKINEQDLNKISDFAKNLKVPEPASNGVIPQFDGYLNLKKYLPIAGNGSGTGFQMKASGLYHLSQIIKQPDVLNLYTYLDLDLPFKNYKENWKYYYKMCESSSSLTFPVHCISAIDFNENDVFLENLKKSLTIDIEDIHHCAYQGVHAGCLAGGWYAIFRGVFGIRPKEECLSIDPRFKNPFKEVKMSFIYQGTKINAIINNKTLILSCKDKKEIKVSYQGKTLILKNKLTINA